MRIRTTTAGILAVLALTLTACGSSDDAKPGASTSPAPSTSPTLTAEDKKQQYLTATYDITFNGTPSDAELLAYPPRWCQELASGHSVEWLFDLTGGGGLYPIGEKWGTAKADANELLVAGVKAYCPENTDAVLEELRASGEY